MVTDGLWWKGEASEALSLERSMAGQLPAARGVLTARDWVIRSSVQFAVLRWFGFQACSKSDEASRSAA